MNCSATACVAETGAIKSQKSRVWGEIFGIAQGLSQISDHHTSGPSQQTQWAAVHTLSGGLATRWGTTFCTYRPCCVIVQCTGETGVWCFPVAQRVLQHIQKIPDDYSQWEGIGLYRVWFWWIPCRFSSGQHGCVLHLLLISCNVFMAVWNWKHEESIQTCC